MLGRHHWCHPLKLHSHERVWCVTEVRHATSRLGLPRASGQEVLQLFLGSSCAVSSLQRANAVPAELPELRAGVSWGAH